MDLGESAGGIFAAISHLEDRFSCFMLRGEAIRLCNVWLLPEKRNAWECLVRFDESAYVVTCNVRSVCFAYVEGPRFSNPHRMVGYI